MPKLARRPRRASTTVAPDERREIRFQGRFIGLYDENVEFRPTNALKRRPGHKTVRTPRGFIAGIARALRLFPHPPPIVVDAKDRIVSGWNVYRAAKLARLALIPVLRAGHHPLKRRGGIDKRRQGLSARVRPRVRP